jgi:glycosyltransferase involved in cell wall biosynthesis
MKTAIVDGDVCYPPTSGKRLRSLNLLLPLARRHRLVYIARGHDEAENEAARRFLTEQGIEAHVIHDPIPKKSGLGFYTRLALNLFSPLPYSVASHFSTRFRDAVRDIAASSRPDLWQLEWSGYLYAVEGLAGPVVLQAHNVDTLIWRRYHEAASGWLRKWYISGQARKFAAFERRAFMNARRVVFVSEEDARLAREWFGEIPSAVVDNGVDVAGFSGVRPAAGPRCVLYLGSLDWRPNLDAVDQLLDTIFPAVRARVPDARLRIVGRKPPEGLAHRVAAVPGAELHADVPDVRPFLEQAGVMAVPLRIGGGSRLKILEALACGLPVVSSAVGAEGLELRDGHDLTIADSDEAMAAALSDALLCPEPAFARAAMGRETVAGRYDWPMLAAKLERVWESSVGQASCLPCAAGARP